MAKHVDFLCPEGYNLQTGGWGKPTPPDDLRKGGLVTLYYRFLSREKPVVWMEFGYTVNGIQTRGRPAMVHIEPAELAIQRAEYENFYSMFLESGARGAAPWWLPGGFRLDERSDFGILEPDGSRAAGVPGPQKAAPGVRQGGRRLVRRAGRSQRWQASGHYPRPRRPLRRRLGILRSAIPPHVKSGRLPYLRTAGTGTTSADCPLVAVGNTPLDGQNPPQFLNAEFNRIEWQDDEAAGWHEVSGRTVTLKKGSTPRCRVQWATRPKRPGSRPAAKAPDLTAAYSSAARFNPQAGRSTCRFPLRTPYLADVELGPFTLPLSAASNQTVSLTMATVRKRDDGGKITISFGQNRVISVQGI